jgi:arylsulfatase A-like enzyme
MVTNIIVVLADDLGYSDIGCYGSEIDTPTLDRMALGGVRASSFYNTARCSPSRASLLTGRHPHETGIGLLNDDLRPEGYPGTMSSDFPTVAELLKARGYSTCLAGKWHLSADTSEPNESWPTRRGFDDFYGILAGASSYYAPPLFAGEQSLTIPADEDYYFTDAVSEHAAGFVSRQADEAEPFFLYLAYTAPHWPLHARDKDIQKYENRFIDGWDDLRERRLARLRASGVLPEDSALSARDETQDAWADVQHKTWQAHRMAVYAAQIEAMDRGIGRVVDALEQTGQADDTLFVFLSDNGACAEEVPPPGSWKFRLRNPSHTRDGRPIALGNQPDIWPGGEDTYSSYGQAWANLSNTPFRLYKRWVHEGGIATPLIVRWPKGGLANGTIMPGANQLTDILPTLIEAAGGEPLADYPGTSMLSALRGQRTDSSHPLFWEHLGNCAARDGKWKAVRLADGEWELYDIERDRAEEHDLASENPGIVNDLVTTWQAWADRVGVIPWPQLEQVLERASQAGPADPPPSGAATGTPGI